MKEHPIIFSTEMVKAILDGRKTQTRRVIKPQPRYSPSLDFNYYYYGKRYICGELKSLALEPLLRSSLIKYCPYGQIGDRLWVREAFCDSCAYICFKVDFEPTGCVGPKWKTGRFLYKADARLWFEITGIRVERLQEITEQDAIAEGIDGDFQEYPRLSFMELWDSINAKRGYSWESNPWVWVIEFSHIPIRTAH